MRAKRFELVDGNDDVRGGMEISERGTARVFVKLPDGKGGIEMNVEEDGTTNVILRDEQDRMRGRLSHRSLSAAAGPGSTGFVISDGERPRAQFGLDPLLDNPNVTLFDHEGTEAASLAVTRTVGTSLTLNDREGTPRAAVWIREDGTPEVRGL